MRNNTPASQQVNKIGSYLYKHLDGAYDISKSQNTCDVKFMILYQDKEEIKTNPDAELYEMHLDLNITTYQNKVRINIIEISDYEKTLSFKTYEPEQLENLQYAFNLVMKHIRQTINRVFKDYEFIF